MLHRQCWLWGHDVRREGGNLLIRHGFQRYRPPKEVNGSSQYILEAGSHRRICLWGFGLFFGREKGIHLGRYEFMPRLTQFKREVWVPDDLPAGPMLSNIYLLEQALRWLAAYERWVLKECGSRYRRTLLYSAPGKNLDTTPMHLSWEELADNLLILRLTKH